MSTTDLSINGCWLYSPEIFEDYRGKFFEWFQDSTFYGKTGENFQIAQANCSISDKGVVRGIHFTSQAPGQSKLVTVLSGKVYDVVVDLRRSSPSFGKWEAVILDSSVPRTLYIPWGVGHGFMAMEDNTVFSYLCDARYNPSNEFDLNAFDSSIGISWPNNFEVIQSEKDSKAPILSSIFDTLPN